MDIGGYDMEICIPDTTERVDRFLASVRKVWPEAVVEREDESTLFVYENASAEETWSSMGWTEANRDQMIAMHATPDGLFFVVDRAESVTARIVRQAAVDLGAEVDLPK